MNKEIYEAIKDLDHCSCDACSPHIHASDCSVHNKGVPELYGPCDCGILPINKPIAYVMQSLRDGSIGTEIAPVDYWGFQKRLDKLNEHPWVKAGAAKIVPLYLKPKG